MIISVLVVNSWRLTWMVYILWLIKSTCHRWVCWEERDLLRSLIIFVNDFWSVFTSKCSSIVNWTRFYCYSLVASLYLRPVLYNRFWSCLVNQTSHISVDHNRRSALTLLHMLLRYESILLVIEVLHAWIERSGKLF